MKVAKNKIVTISYLLTSKTGEELDRSQPGDPLVYLHGVGNLVPGLEKELEGMKSGEKKTKIEVAPGEAYGELRDDLQLTVKRSQFPADADLAPGTRFWANSPDGQQHPFMVVAVEGDEVDIDGNHPLAGETLVFDIEIHEVRDATAEEIQHGHAHGPDGHHH